MTTHELIRSMAILDAHPGHEQDTIELLRDFYTSINQKGYSSDLLYRDAKTPSRFVHIRVWNSEALRTEAQHDPEVHRYWVRLSEICTITTIYEELEPIFSTYKGITAG
jgi:quinol monooxygenase YgiN